MRGEKRKIAKERAGQIILSEIAKELDASRSPVKDGSFKKQLSKEYAKKKGQKNSDLYLTGNMQSQLRADEHPRGVKVGIRDAGQAAKAHGHHKDTRGILPKREFIPEPSGSFKDKIMRKVAKAIDELRDGN